MKDMVTTIIIFSPVILLLVIALVNVEISNCRVRRREERRREMADVIREYVKYDAIEGRGDELATQADLDAMEDVDNAILDAYDELAELVKTNSEKIRSLERKIDDANMLIGALQCRATKKVDYGQQVG